MSLVRLVFQFWKLDTLMQIASDHLPQMISERIRHRN
jgi:hypothetical protein